MKPLERYIAQNVFSRCGQAVTRLAGAGLIPRPALAQAAKRPTNRGAPDSAAVRRRS